MDHEIKAMEAQHGALKSDTADKKSQSAVLSIEEMGGGSLLKARASALDEAIKKFIDGARLAYVVPSDGWQTP